MSKRAKVLTIIGIWAYIMLILIETSMHMSDVKAGKKLYSKKEVVAQGLTVPTKLYTEGNITLLAKLMDAENGNASDECMYLTGVVVLKRVKSKAFPNSVHDVIYQRGQYSTASRLDGIKPSERALELANELLINGVDDYPDKLVFQSMFPQGASTYKLINGEYFCLAK